MAIETQDVQIDGQPISVQGTVTGNQGTPNTPDNSWPVEVTDGTNVLGTPSHPVRTDPTGTTTQPVSGTVTANAGTGNFTVVQPTGTNLHVVVDSGTITTSDTKSNSATISQSTVTTTSSTILAANANRKRMVIFVASSNTRIAFGNSAASTSNFTYAATSNNVTIEDDVWTGAVQAVTTGGTSVVTVTEMV